jgi:hypothetical protein
MTDADILDSSNCSDREIGARSIGRARGRRAGRQDREHARRLANERAAPASDRASASVLPTYAGAPDRVAMIASTA